LCRAKYFWLASFIVLSVLLLPVSGRADEAIEGPLASACLPEGTMTAVLTSPGVSETRPGGAGLSLDVAQKQLRAVNPSDKAALAEALNRLGVALRFAGQYPEAENAYFRAEALAKDAGNGALAATIQQNLALLAGMAGDYKRAAALLHKSAEGAARLRDSEQRAIAREGEANARLFLGDVDGARNIYHQLEAQLQGSGGGPRLASVLLNMAVAYERVGQFTESGRLLDRATAEARKSGDRLIEAKAMNSQALLLDRAGNMEGASKLLIEAYRAAAAVNDVGAAATTLYNLGAVVGDVKRYGGKANPRRAIACFQEVIKQRRGIGDRAGTAVTLNALGASYTNVQAYDDASKILDKAARNFEALGDIQQEAAALSNLGWNEVKRKRYADAIPPLERAATLIDRLRAGVASDADRVSFFANGSDSRLLLVDLYLETGKTDAAFLALEAAKARGLLDQLARIPLESVDSQVAQAAAEARRVRAVWAAADRKVGDLSVLTGPDAPAGQLKARQERAVAGLEVSQAERRLASALGLHRAAEPASIDRIRTSLSPSEVLIEYKVSVTRLQIFVLTRNRLTAVTHMVARAELEDAAIRFRSAVEGGDDGLADGVQLYQHVLGPIAPLLKGYSRIRFVADGPLLLIPFAALPSSATNERSRLLWHFDAISSLPSASALVWLAQRQIRNTAERPGLIVGHPAYGNGAGTVPNCGTMTLPDLPASAAEAAAVAQALELKPESGDVLIGGDATPSRVEKKDLPVYRYIHFAVHGVLCQTRPGGAAEAALALSPERAGTPGSVLRSEDIIGQKLNADLVALSGCETAIGAEEAGEGLLNLARSFLIAGARGTVTTLWRIEDEATSALMKDFYRRLKASGDAASSLVAAQRWLASEQYEVNEAGDSVPLAMPLYWAAFTVIGDSR
jgi:CHAT domain-containing protein